MPPSNSPAGSSGGDLALPPVLAVPLVFPSPAGRVTLAPSREGCGAGREHGRTPAPGSGGPRGWSVILHMLIEVSLLPGGRLASFTVGSGGSSRRLLEEAEFSLREHFESSLLEQIVHFSSGPDRLVSFGVHWGGLTATAFTGAVEKSPWPRAQPCTASCFHNNGC